ncbi:MAG: protein containing DUF61 [Candidatus Syntrophoarchaeum caldarius]|uniref:UPF0216 protein SCAL_000860 n=1 Tax=Candidatus Syntropharchaeum caldarium TaxID=1838285 RepID=A0A1F2PA14_9EURY|nr:MAG: protein containing DUF61 [Candidatus Syntrophoarchaeum caldarius]
MQTDRIIAKSVQGLNKHLPKARKSLHVLLGEERPAVETKDGEIHRIKRAELEMIADMVAEADHRKVVLPILIEMSPDCGPGASKIRGKIYCRIVMELIGREWKGEEEILIYRPEVRQLRRLLPTASQYAFFMHLQ